MKKSDAMKKFEEKLVARLQVRKTKHGAVYVFDYRCQEFAPLGRNSEMLRNPLTIGWPDEGRPTTSREEAERWTRKHYAKRIRGELNAKRDIAAEIRGPLSVARACDTYVSELASVPGHSVHTLKNRRAIIEAHIKPRLGHLPIETLDRKRVREFLASVKVRKFDQTDGWTQQAASIGYKRDLRACLRAVWKANLPDVDPPFDGMKLRGPSKSAARRAAITAGEVEPLLEPASGAQTPQQLMRTLTAAMYYDDRYIARRQNTSRWAVANTAEAIAFEVATGARSEELLLMRWKFIQEQEGAILVPGTKTEAGLRWVPLQHTLVPWIERLKSKIRPVDAPSTWQPDPNAFVFTTNSKRPSGMGSKRALTNRFTKALQLAGTKKPGKAQHWARATYATMLSVQVTLKTEGLKQYLGHADSFGGATDAYVTAMVPYMPPEHRSLVLHLPGPQEVEAELERFQPQPLPAPRASGKGRVGRRAARDVQRHAG